MTCKRHRRHQDHQTQLQPAQEDACSAAVIIMYAISRRQSDATEQGCCQRLFALMSDPCTTTQAC
jgi:hypothetical protein